MKISIIPIIGAIVLCTNITLAQDSLWTSGRPDGHAPVGVMGDHYHHTGQVMISYRYMPMFMKGNLSGSDEISDESIYQNYMVSPQKMTMQMHMLGAMYAPADWVTLMVMANYTQKSMDLRTKSGIDFNTKSSGFGNTSLSGLFKIVNKNRQSLHGNLGFSFPTGDIDQSDATPMSSKAQLAYPMQMGSGTVDPFFGFTYVGQGDLFSWGVQSIYKFRMGDNSQGYSLGNRFDATGWGAIKASECLSFSARLNYYNQGGINGVDPDLNPNMMPLFNTVNSGRGGLDMGIGSNFYVPSGALKDFRIGAEVGIPVTQHVQGIQMKNQVMGTIGIQYTLGE